MSKPVEIKPDGLRRAATGFDEVADRAKKVLDNLKSSSESKGEPWGDDHAGERFANGDKGYKKNRDNTFTSLSTLVDVFHSNAKNLRDSATTFEENEKEMANAKEPLHPTRRDAIARPYNYADRKSTDWAPTSRFLRDATVTERGTAPFDAMRPTESTPHEAFRTDAMRPTEITPREALRADMYTPEGTVTDTEITPREAFRADMYTPEGTVTDGE
ncbi:type VII secretion target [Nocardia sp. NBC_01499]|uniref:WXG100 family type VII secretion target n=1 Tax=Nocardia sp. NBC_01499 TaxID=2903597 RepID=UPI003867B7B3